MKLVVSIKDLVKLEDELDAGSLVGNVNDQNATGMIVRLLDESSAVVLWSTPPKDLQLKFGEIW